MVRRYNAQKMVESRLWADASSAIMTYQVVSCITVELRAFPDSASPKTGFRLYPQTKFFSKQSRFDNKGNLWIRVCNLGTETSTCTNDFRKKRRDIIKPPPQGWICVQPEGIDSPPIVKRTNSTLKCFSCGGCLNPSISFSNRRGKGCHQRYTTVPETGDCTAQKGETLFVAATMEPVKVLKSTTKGRIYCTFPSIRIENNSAQTDEEELDMAIWYRPSDLVRCSRSRNKEAAPEGADIVTEDTVIYHGQPRTRRDIFVLCNGDINVSKKIWNEASKTPGTCIRISNIDYASCSKGHLLHARCFQQAILEGGRCPSPGCNKPLFSKHYAKLW